MSVTELKFCLVGGVYSIYLQHMRKTLTLRMECPAFDSTTSNDEAPVLVI